VEVAAALVILLIVFGPPSQLSTIIGLATAGLTVAMKDFIVAFLGWFTLIGKNGIHPGDWVEIEGIGGEVIELSLMHTVLLELGDSAGAGHPTGRRVTFVNSYAIEKRWFNFTTTGQWLWDELLVTLPPETDPYRVAEQMRLVVERETNPDAEAANRDWARVTRDYAVSQFSATVRMDLRPSSNGLEVRIRYITSAQKRFEMKSKLLREIVAITYPVLDEAAQVAKPIECGAPKPAPRMDVPAPG